MGQCSIPQAAASQVKLEKYAVSLLTMFMHKQELYT